MKTADYFPEDWFGPHSLVGVGQGILVRGAILEIGLEREAQKKEWVGARSRLFSNLPNIFPAHKVFTVDF